MKLQLKYRKRMFSWRNEAIMGLSKRVQMYSACWVTARFASQRIANMCLLMSISLHNTFAPTGCPTECLLHTVALIIDNAASSASWAQRGRTSLAIVQHVVLGATSLRQLLLLTKGSQMVTAAASPAAPSHAWRRRSAAARALLRLGRPPRACVLAGRVRRCCRLWAWAAAP